MHAQASFIEGVVSAGEAERLQHGPVGLHGIGLQAVYDDVAGGGPRHDEEGRAAPIALHGVAQDRGRGFRNDIGGEVEILHVTHARDAHPETAHDR